VGRISDEDVQRVRDATDLVSLVSERIVLKQKGRLFWGLCPFHGEKTPSLKVDPATQLWHCFGCGLGGDAFGFVIESDKVDFPESVRILAERARIEIAEETGGVPRGRKERLLATCEEAAAFYHRILTGSREDGPTRARDYLAGREFGSEIAKTWRLGYAPGRSALVRHLSDAGFTAEEMVEANVALRSDDGRLRDRFYERIMFPISDLQGRTIAFGGRILGTGEPKYLNSADTPLFKKSANMYAIDRAKGPMTAKGTAVVVEGYTDVIALHRAGIDNAVATLGTSLTRQHVKMLGRFARRVVYLFDGDEAGMRAADRASEFIDSSMSSEEWFGQQNTELTVALVPDGMDPADYVTERGPEALAAVVDAAEPLLRFSIDRRLARWDLDRPEERLRALKDAAEILSPVKGSGLADEYARYIHDVLLAAGADIDTSIVKKAIASSRHAPGGREQEHEESVRPANPADTTRLRTERELLAILANRPPLRSRAQELLRKGLLSTPEHKAIAEVLVQLGPGPGSDEVHGILEQRVPGSARCLAGTRLDDTGTDTDLLAQGLERRLKEFELERRIAVGKARLKSADSFKDSAQYDDVIREVSALQRVLDALRRGEDVIDDHLEAQEQRG
jgi:DNA primase